MEETEIDIEKRKNLDKYHEWYNFPPVIWSMFNASRDSDINFITVEDNPKSSRYFLNTTYNTLKSHLDALNILSGNKFTNIYMSLLKIKKGSVPFIQTYDLKARKETELYREYDENYVKYADITEEHGAFPLYFDIDVDSINDIHKAVSATKIIVNELYKFCVPFGMKFSGSRGFHVFIPHIYMPSMKLEDTIELISKVLTKFAIIHDIVDYVDVQSSTRIKGLIKLPFSADIKSGKLLIALPLSQYDLEHFEISKISYDFVRKNITIKDRGELIETHGLPIENLRKNVLKFLNQYK